MDIFRRIPLSADERAMQKAYEQKDQWLWENAMTISQYKEYLDSGTVLHTEYSDYFFDKTQGRQGVTNDKVSVISEEEEISVLMHPRFSYPVIHNHAYIEIIYVVSGSCIHFVEGQSFAMKAGDICVLAPSALHAISVTREDTVIMNILAGESVFSRFFLEILRGDYVMVNFFESILKDKSASSYILFPTGEDLWMQATANLMAEEILGKKYGYEKALTLYVQQIFLHLVRNYEMMAVVAGTETGGQNEHIVALLGYLSVNYHCATLTNTAEFFGYSATYLSKLIKKYTGQNFTSIITELQMTNAKRMMDEGKANITEIAQAVGCFDSSHFNKKFKNQFGISPSDYIRQVR